MKFTKKSIMALGSSYAIIFAFLAFFAPVRVAAFFMLASIHIALIALTVTVLKLNKTK